MTAYIAVLLTIAVLSPPLFTADNSSGAFTRPAVKAVAFSTLAFAANERGKQNPISVPAVVAGAAIASDCSDSRRSPLLGSLEPFRAGLMLVRPNGSRAPPSAVSFRVS